MNPWRRAPAVVYSLLFASGALVFGQDVGFGTSTPDVFGPCASLQHVQKVHVERLCAD